MWMVDVKCLCRKHLLGEHQEMHSFTGTIKKGISIKGYLKNGLIETHNLKKRHDELANEMTRRGYNHKSELEDLNLNPNGCVNSEENIQELIRRCPDCRSNFLK
jgi:hypothetical protein